MQKNRKERGGDVPDVKEQIKNDYLSGVPPKKLSEKYDTTDGTCLKQFQFALTSKEAYDGDARTGIANSGFYQSFEEWTEQNNLDDIFPELDGHDAVKVEVLQSGYLFAPDVDLGRYQMICRLIYK